MTEEEYWFEYNAALDRCTKNNVRCKCCDTIVMLCIHWQKLRLVVNPAPSERKLLECR